MAIERTPLGFQKPDGDEPMRQGNDVISANAQTAQDLLAADRARLALLERSAGFPADPLEQVDEVVGLLVTTSGTTTGAALNATFVRFEDEAGNPVPDRNVVIKVSSTTGEILDIVTEA